MIDFNQDEINSLLSSLKRIADALEHFPTAHELKEDGVSIHSSSLEEMNTKMEELGYLHGIAKQIDELKEDTKLYRTDDPEKKITYYNN